MLRSFVMFLVLCVLAAVAQQSQHKQVPEMMPAMVYDDNSEALQKVSQQLLNALATLEAMQGVSGPEIKREEKRRNKFEFIRFGRK